MTRRAAPQSTLKAVRDKWYADCRASGVSGTTANLGLGITGLCFVVSSALAGYHSALHNGAQVQSVRCRRSLDVITHAPVTCAQARVSRSALLRHSLFSKALLVLSVPPLVLSLALYLAALPQWGAGASKCKQCFDIYGRWLSDAPRTNQNANACPVPTHLTGIPAGVHVVAGVAVSAGGLYCFFLAGDLRDSDARRAVPPLQGGVALCFISKLVSVVNELVRACAASDSRPATRHEAGDDSVDAGGGIPIWRASRRSARRLHRSSAQPWAAFDGRTTATLASERRHAHATRVW